MDSPIIIPYFTSYEYMREDKKTKPALLVLFFRHYSADKAAIVM